MLKNLATGSHRLPGLPKRFLLILVLSGLLGAPGGPLHGQPGISSPVSAVPVVAEDSIRRAKARTTKAPDLLPVPKSTATASPARSGPQEVVADPLPARPGSERWALWHLVLAAVAGVAAGGVVAWWWLRYSVQELEFSVEERRKRYRSETRELKSEVVRLAGENQVLEMRLNQLRPQPVRNQPPPPPGAQPLPPG